MWRKLATFGRTAHTAGEFGRTVRTVGEFGRTVRTAGDFGRTVHTADEFGHPVHAAPKFGLTVRTAAKFWHSVHAATKLGHTVHTAALARFLSGAEVPKDKDTHSLISQYPLVHFLNLAHGNKFSMYGVFCFLINVNQPISAGRGRAGFALCVPPALILEDCARDRQTEKLGGGSER